MNPWLETEIKVLSEPDMLETDQQEI